MIKPIIAGKAYPLGLDNVDTDQIIAAEHLKTLSRAGLGKYAFGTLRREKGNIFDDPRYLGARILVAGANFGCGSSREHSVWALKDLGVEAVIAGGFSDIFAGNALKNGIATISLGPASLELVLTHSKSGLVSIDLDRKTIGLGKSKLPFVMDEGNRSQLLTGSDEIGMTISYEAMITAYEQKSRGWSVAGEKIGTVQLKF